MNWINMDSVEVESNFSFNSILNQVLKPLDVKTKFYNAEVSLHLYVFYSV